MFQISNRGGVMPQWRRDGRELFYIDLDGTLRAVDIDLEAAEFGTPHGLFATGLRLTPYSMWMNQYAVANDGQSFLLNRAVEQPAGDDYGPSSSIAASEREQSSRRYSDVRYAAVTIAYFPFSSSRNILKLR